MKKTLKTVLAVLLGTMMIMGVLGGCAKEQSGPTSAPTPNDAGGESPAPASPEPIEEVLTELTVGLDNDPTSLDPWSATDTLASTIFSTVYEGLLGYDEENNIIPVLAQELPLVEQDATVITFKLRQGIKFHDGADFNAEAVKLTLERALDPANGLSRRSLIECIDTIEVIDAYTVRLNLKYSFAPILNAFAHQSCMMLSPKLIESGEDISTHPAGTGPYVFGEWMDGDHVSVVRNADYWNADAMARFSSIKFLPRPEAATRVAGLQTGEIDVIYPVPSDQFQLLSTQTGLDVMCEEGNLVLFFEMNTQKAPFNDVRVRQAFNYAFDNEAFVQVVENGYGVPSTSSMASCDWGYQAQTMYEYDTEKAKALLAEAGFPDGFSCTLYINTTSKSQKMAEFLQQQLALINVDLKIASYEKAQMNEICSARPEESVHDLRCGGWGPSTMEADWATRPILTRATWSCDGGSNYSYYTNERVEELIQIGLSSTDQNERLAAYAEMQRIIVEDAPWIFVDTPGVLWAKNSNVQGIYITACGQIVLSQGYRTAG